MALQKDFDLTGGVTITSAYHKVNHLRIDIENSLAEISVAIYKDKTTSDSGGSFILTKSFLVGSDNFSSFLTPTAIDPLNINHVSQSYEYLKTLPDYTGAVDV